MDALLKLLWIYRAFMAVLGLVIGSFLNVCIWRVPRGESIAKGRSHCTSCGRTLTAPELVPVFSFIFLGGRCKSCKAKISPRYPLVELITGAAFFLAALIYGWSWMALVMCAFFALLVVVAFIDMDTQTIPNGLVLAIALLGVIAFFLPPPAGLPVVQWWERLIGGACVSLPVLLIAWLLNGFGYGDVKLTAAAGLLLGWRLVLVAFGIGVVLGGAVGGILLATKKAGRKTAIAFGPYLCIGMFAAALIGQHIVNFYAVLF